MIYPLCIRKVLFHVWWIIAPALGFIFIAGVSSCIMIPYEPSAEVSLSDKGHIPPGEVMVTVGPRNLLEEVSEEIAKTDARIEIVDPITFRDAAFPDGGWTVSQLFQEGNCRRVSSELDVDYLVLIGGVKETPGDEVGGIIIYIGFYGAGYSEEEVSLSATIIDLKNERPLYDVNSSAQGTFGGVGLFYGLFITPMTESGAIEGLGYGIAKNVINNSQAEKVRIAVLALENLEEAHQREEKLKRMPETAAQGDQEAQWTLYEMESTEKNLIWLCRAADQGHVNARYELGELYYYGSDKYRNFENIHVIPDLSRSCMWFSLAGYVQISGQPNQDNNGPLSVLYKSAEVQRTAMVMTRDELEEAKRLITIWKPGQCGRDISRYSENLNMLQLCSAADNGDFSAREELGKVYYSGLNGIEYDLPRAYLWYQLAAMVYKPPDQDDGVIPSHCEDMTPEQLSITAKLLDGWKPGNCEQELLH